MFLTDSIPFRLRTSKPPYSSVNSTSGELFLSVSGFANIITASNNSSIFCHYLACYQCQDRIDDLLFFRASLANCLFFDASSNKLLSVEFIAKILSK